MLVLYLEGREREREIVRDEETSWAILHFVVVASFNSILQIFVTSGE